MPELPEVETIKSGLAPLIEGAVIANVICNRKDLRYPLPDKFAARLKGRKIEKLSRRSKYLLLGLDNGKTLVVHLGMSGKLLHHKKSAPAAKHDHIIVELKDGSVLVFNDPRRFGMMDIVNTANMSEHKIFSHLGPEPLTAEFDGKYLADALKGRKTPIKLAIMAAEIVVGVGNIYASESLFRAHIMPTRSAGSLSCKQYEALAEAIKQVLEDAIKAGGSTLKDYVTSSGDSGYFQHSFRVYGRDGQPCVECHALIAKKTMSGRSTYYCSACQD
jgi:formamidopyrimidine-DNA glycosylase